MKPIMTRLDRSCYVALVMDYASGIWGFPHHTKLDGIQNRTRRVFLGVHRYSPLLCLEGDTGWMKAKNRLRYWNRLVKMHFDRLPKKEYLYGNIRMGRITGVLKDIF